MSKQLDSFLKGIALFNQGVKEWSIADANEEAKAQLDAARVTFQPSAAANPQQAELEAQRFEDARNQISQDLRSRLGALGADPNDVQNATNFGLTFAQEKAFELQEQQMESTLQRSVIAAQTSAAQTGQKALEFEMKKQKHERNFVEDFAKKTTPLKDKLSKIKSASALLNDALTNETSANALKPLLAGMLQSGPLTEPEQAAFAGNAGLLDTVRGFYKKWIRGEGALTPKAKENLQKYIDIVYEVNAKEFDNQKNNFIKTYSPSMEAVQIDPKSFAKKIDVLKFTPPSVRLTETTNSRQTQINQFDAILTDPVKYGFDPKNSKSKQELEQISKTRNILTIQQQIELGRLKRIKALGGN